MSDNLKTIRELAEELGVSKKKIHYQVSKLDTDLIQRLDGTIYLDKSAISKIKSSIGYITPAELDTSGIQSRHKLDSVLDTEKKGTDMKKYHKLVNTYFSVGNDNANKVQNSLIFGDKWKILSINKKKKLLHYLEIIMFDPEKYVVFLLKIEKNINILTKGQQKPVTTVSNYIKSLHDSFKSDKTYSIRDGLIDSNYYIQSQKSKASLEYIPRLSSDFYQYILHFII